MKLRDLRRFVKRWYGLVFLGFVSLCFHTTGLAENLLRVANLNLTSEYRWVVLGIQSQATTAKNFEALGFTGKKIQSVDPKFLFEIYHDRIQRVHSFEMKTFGTARSLIDIPNARKSEKKQAIKKGFKSFFKTLGFPFSTAAILSTRHQAKVEKELTFHANYLLQLIHLALPDYSLFPELVEALSPDKNTQVGETELRILGEAILTRYNPESIKAGLKVPQQDNGNFFELWRKTQTGLRSQNKAIIVSQANQRNLRIASAGDFFGIVFLEASEHSTREQIEKQLEYLRFVGLGLDKRDADLIARVAQKYAQTGPVELQGQVQEQVKGKVKGQVLIPWYLVSFSNERGPLDLANFIAPRTFIRKLRHQADLQFVSDVGGSLLPFGNWVTQLARKKRAKIHQFQGKTTYLRRAPSYGSILALTETQAVPFEFTGDLVRKEEIAFEEFDDAIGTMGVGEVADAGKKTENTSEILHFASSSLLKSEQDGSELHYLRVRNTQAMQDSIKTLHQKLDDTVLQNIQLLEEILREVSQKEESKRAPTTQKESGGNRGPASLKASPVPLATSSDRKPVILFLVDGLRPDRFEEAAASGLIPNLASLFYKRGIQLQSATSRSLTLPSWGSIFTGWEPDYNGLKSNTPGSRLAEKITENYTDARRDLLHPSNWVKNRAYKRLEENKTGFDGKIWLPGYFDPHQVLFNHMPIVNGATRSVLKLLGDYFSRKGEYLNKVRFQASALDHASADLTAERILKDARKKNRLRLIMNWYAGVDEASHYNNSIMPYVLKEIDEGVGKILAAARAHPSLKDATVFLVSDHGHTGGFGPFGVGTSLGITPEEKTWTDDQPPLLVNTALNLTRFFAGENADYPQYDFAVGAAIPPEPKYDLGLNSFISAPYAITYPFRFKKPTALVDCSGDNIAQIYLKRDSHWRRLALNQLLKMNSKSKNGKDLTPIEDLLKMQLPNLNVTHPVLAGKIAALTSTHPVALIGVPLQGDAARESADNLGARRDSFASTREPVVIFARSKVPGANDYRTGLILTRSSDSGHDEFRYIVVKNLALNGAGKLQAEVSTEPNDDPLEYLGNVEGAHQFYQWRTDREWLKLAQNHKWPTAVFSLSRLVTLSSKFTDPDSILLSDRIKKARVAEIPDFVIMANPGYGLQSSEPMESDHGGLAREEVFNTFMVSSIDKKTFPIHLKLDDHAVLNRDVMPTVLSYAGLGEAGSDPLPLTQGESIKPWLDGVLEQLRQNGPPK